MIDIMGQGLAFQHDHNEVSHLYALSGGLVCSLCACMLFLCEDVEFLCMCYLVHSWTA